ncbi:UDP-N-acetylmuramate--alanine ligase [Fulvivirga imtechensis AK7]|uniref:UDP-N-acetylmuramate--L-alanine ligase n=1 Tax=Fulvivirga imtechensis AK7 TaxID=1237149 RepID=L8JSN2_9BACT|nr:UDP-N-acetylmuramate--alanine ligase [Fulvivirga imtechensis AK7]
MYFIGIGGIGMSALARWFKANNYYVAGYDRTDTDLTRQLVEEGMDIHYEDEVDAIPARIRDNRERSLVVFTPAIPKSHNEYNYLKESGFSIHKRSQVLGMISNAFKTVAVGGTHGKTTTSSMVAHILKNAGMDITAFLGGIATNYDSNFIRNEKIDENTVAVVEADEFDRSFLALNPDIAVVTASDADHLDIYGDKASLETSFKEFIAKVKADGKLFVNEKIAKDLVDSSYSRTVCTYGINQGQFFASEITMSNGFFEFNYSDERFKIERIKLGVPGFHNVENATVAIAIALELGLHPEEVKHGIETYKGVKRRFEYLLRSDKIVFVDDYAHHPVEIEAFLGSLRAMYPDRKITAIFQPHLYSRTRDFAEGFAKSLSLADEVILLDIYPAREEPIEGVSADIIFKDISADSKMMCSKTQLVEVLKKKDLEVVATIGAGDIDRLVYPVFEYLKDRYHA